MNDTPRELARIQRWMQAVIMHPDGVADGIASERARAEIDVSADDVQRVINRSKAQNSIERLEVYGNAYFARLLDVLRDEFPALRHAVGEDAFDGFAFGYLQAYPSSSYTLADLSTNFPRYLEETRPADDDGQARPDWIDFLIDLAVLERAYGEVFCESGSEDGSHLKPEDLEAIPPQRWADARLIPTQCLRLMTFRFPVHEYATAVRNNKDPAPLDQPSTTWLVISRRDFVVRRLAVSRVQYELLRAIVDGHNLGEAIGRSVEATDADVNTLTNQLGQWFKAWAAAQFFQAVELPAPDD
jgi:hypothetical protein